MRHHLGSALNWPFMVFDISLLSFFFFLAHFHFDPEKFTLLIFCKPVRFFLSLTPSPSLSFSPLFNSTSQPPSPQLDICLFPSLLFCLRHFNFHPTSSVCFPHFFRIALEGFTKTAICQGHRLHFAICCKIKLGEVVYLSLFGLPLPSAIFPFASGLTRQERERDGGR